FIERRRTLRGRRRLSFLFLENWTLEWTFKERRDDSQSVSRIISPVEVDTQKHTEEREHTSCQNHSREHNESTLENEQVVDSVHFSNTAQSYGNIPTDHS